MQTQKMTQFAVAIAAVFAVSFYGYAQLGGTSGVTIPYAGFIERDGTSLSDDISITFSVFDAETDGNVCYGETLTVSPVEGRFSVSLGPVPDVCVVDRDVWLEVATPSGVLSSRQRVVPSLAAHTSGRGDFVVADVLTVKGPAFLEAGATAATLDVDGAATFGNLSVGATIGDGVMTVRNSGLGAGQKLILDANEVTSENRNGLTPLTLNGAPVAVERDLSVRLDLTVSGDVDVTGRVQRDEYDVSCAAGPTAARATFCCRTHVRTGVTACRSTSIASQTLWGSVTPPFVDEGTNGPYSISCTGPGNDPPMCCLQSGSGSMTCRYNTSPTLDAWENAGNAF